MTYGYWQDTRNRTCFGAPLTTVAAPCTAFGHAHSVLTSVSAFQSACAPSHNHATEQLAPCGPWHARLLSALASTVSTGCGDRPRLRVLLRIPHWGGRMRAGLCVWGPFHPRAGGCVRRVVPSAARSVLSAAFSVCQACEACTLCSCGHCTRMRLAYYKGACACRHHVAEPACSCGNNVQKQQLISA